MCVADYLSPNRKILSATCEVAIMLRNIDFQQVLPIVKDAVAHAFSKPSYQIQNIDIGDMMASLKDDFIYDEKTYKVRVMAVIRRNIKT